MGFEDLRENRRITLSQNGINLHGINFESNVQPGSDI